MKQILFFLVLSVSLVYGCSRKVTPTIPDRPIAPISGNKVDTADLRSANPLIAGSAIYKMKCTKCHTEKAVADWTVEEWKPILNSMVKKAKLNDLEIAQVTQYVNTHAKK